MSGGREWRLLSPAEVMARGFCDHVAEFARAMGKDPRAVADSDQWDAAQREVLRGMGPVPGFKYSCFEVDEEHRKRLLAWVIAALNQATQHGLKKCEHVFRTPAPGILAPGTGYAMCDRCIEQGKLPMEASSDTRCEVCGQPSSWFRPIILPWGGIRIVAESCDSCFEWVRVCIREAS